MISRSNSDRIRGQHASDADLFRQLDGAESEDSATLGEHLAHCRDCSNRLHELAGRCGRFSDLLEISDTVAPSRVLPVDHGTFQRKAPLVRRVVVAAALVALGVFVSPYAWAGIQRIGKLVWVSEGEVAPQPSLEARVLLHPRETVLTVAFSASQERGSVTLVPTRDSLASLRALGSTTPVEFLVDDLGVQVVNHDQAVNDYELAIPAGVREVRISVGGAVVAEVSAQGDRLESRPIVMLDGTLGWKPTIPSAE